jgi:mono/diheme cytochrome c family protein
MRRAALIVGACLAMAGVQAKGAEPAKPSAAAREQAGKAVFDKWCAPCHAPNPRLAGTLALQTKYEGKLPAALEQRTDLTTDMVEYYVRNGVAWMAPFRKTEVTDAELADLAAYLTRPAGRRSK